jgi:hypothetical protein
MNMKPIDRIDATALSAETFAIDYFRGNRPLVINGGASHWRAMERWSRPYFESRLGERMVPIDYSQDGFLTYTADDQDRNASREDVPFLRAAAEIHDPTGDRRCYLRNVSLPDLCPELLEDIEVPALVGDPSKITMNHYWYGAPGCTTSLHQDWPSNFLAQVIGRKRVVLFDPDERGFLYPAGQDPPKPGATIDLREHSLVNPEQPDHKRFPLFRQATPFVAILQPGDILWLPPEWWHQIRALDVSVSVNFWWQPHIEQFLFSPRRISKLPVLYDTGFAQTFLTTAMDHRELDGTLGVAEHSLALGCPWVAVLLGAVAVETGLRGRLEQYGVGEAAGRGDLRAPALNAELAAVAVDDCVDAATMAQWSQLIEQAKAMGDTRPTATHAAGMLRTIRAFLARPRTA